MCFDVGVVVDGGGGVVFFGCVDVGGRVECFNFVWCWDYGGECGVYC